MKIRNKYPFEPNHIVFCNKNVATVAHAWIYEYIVIFVCIWSYFLYMGYLTFLLWFEESLEVAVICRIHGVHSSGNIAVLILYVQEFDMAIIEYWYDLKSIFRFVIRQIPWSMFHLNLSITIQFYFQTDSSIVTQTKKNNLECQIKIRWFYTFASWPSSTTSWWVLHSAVRFTMPCSV